MLLPSQQPAGQGIPKGCLALVLLTLAIIIYALFIVGAQAISLLVALLTPPMPPIPPQAYHWQPPTVDAFGRDVWYYEVEAEACNILTFYQQTASCVTRITCPQTVPNHRAQPIAECHADQLFNTFTMRWQALISIAPDKTQHLRITLSRLILWTTEPLPNPTPIFILPR